MRKAAKIGSQAFVFLHEQTLVLDRGQTATPYPFPSNVADMVLDFSCGASERCPKAFTADGDALSLAVYSDMDSRVLSFWQWSFSAWIHGNEILGSRGTVRETGTSTRPRRTWGTLKFGSCVTSCPIGSGRSKLG
jgi:hypothetical protein